MRVLTLACAVPALSVVALTAAPVGSADAFFANYQLVVPARYDFHTWAWSVSHCIPAADDCRSISGIPMPVAKAFDYVGEARLVEGRYTMIVDVPDGLRCGNLYYGPLVATRDAYSWDAVTMQGTLTSSFVAGCDGAPGTLTYPFSLVRL